MYAPADGAPGHAGQMRSSIAGLGWPALPDGPGAAALAVQFQLDLSQWWSAGELERWQMKQLHSVLAHARATIPFWRARLDAAGFDKTVRPDRAALRSLPLLRRGELHDLGDAMLSAAVPPGHGPVTRSGTSGSTGVPVAFYTTALTEFFWRAFSLREHFWQRRDFSAKLAAIRLKVRNGSAAGWGPATDAVFRTGPCALLDLQTDIDSQLDWLAAKAPHYLITMATNLRWLAERALERGLRLPDLRQARSYGGAVDDDTREAVRRAWQVEVVDMYTAAEVGYIALQCPRYGHYHVQSENLIVEILDDAGNPCAAGESGRVVVTTLHNFAMPLIRYEIGDYAEAGAACECGRGLPVIRRICGRERNMIKHPDGRRYWPSFPQSRWAHLAPVRQLQLVQKSRQDMLVRIVAPRELDALEARKLIAALQDCLGHPFRMTIERSAEIPRRDNFKFEDFVSEVAD
jgi:phenylacetate-CoA ligase